MESLLITKLILSVIILLLIYAGFKIVKSYAKSVKEKNNLDESRYILIVKILFALSVIIILAVFTYIWGIEIRNLWVSITGLLAMVAIAFFAVWSLIGNLLAGFLLYFTSPFKINDIIEVHPEIIKGKVLAINLFFTLLIDEEHNYFNIPNSMFFQKFIKVYDRKKLNKNP